MSAVDPLEHEQLLLTIVHLDSEDSEARLDWRRGTRSGEGCGARSAAGSGFERRHLGLEIVEVLDEGAPLARREEHAVPLDCLHEIARQGRHRSVLASGMGSRMACH